MRGSFALGALAATCVACSAAPAPERQPRTIRVATWNVHRFFDDRCDSGRCGRGDFELQPSAEDFAQNVDRAAAAIRALEADVVLLQEIETQGALDAIAAAAQLPEPATATLAEIGGDATLDVAVIARAAMIERRPHRDVLMRPDGSATIFSRALLEVHLDFDGARVVVLCAHFRSQRDDDPGRRQAEAEASGRIAAEVRAAHPEALIVLGGDLNDVPGSTALDALEREGDLTRLARELSDDSTYDFEGEGLALDHLYVPRSITDAYVPASVKIARDAGARGFGGSDHRALSAVLEIPAD